MPRSTQDDEDSKGDRDDRDTVPDLDVEHEDDEKVESSHEDDEDEEPAEEDMDIELDDPSDDGGPDA
jgi:hypothetical protein